MRRSYDADITTRHLLAHTAGFEERVAGIISTGAVLVESLAAAVLAARYPAETPGTETLAAVASHVSSSALSYLLAAFLGVFVATRRRYRQMVQAQAAEQVRAQRARLRAAVTAERSQIARELHDVAAHHLSGMVVQAAAVERLIDRDPPADQAGAAWLRRQGKETLDNLRQVVGYCGSGPIPGLPGPILGDPGLATAHRCRAWQRSGTWSTPPGRSAPR